MIQVLMLCTGNICRSPIAEGLLRTQVTAAGLSDRIGVDSAGTTDYHAGEPPDRRARQVMRARGFDIDDLRARPLSVIDLQRFDYLLAMDDSHLAALQRLAARVESPGAIHRIMVFAPDWTIAQVPDPYYGGEQGFEQVVDMLEAATSGFLAHLRQTHPQLR